jgi:hypothetical protein
MNDPKFVEKVAEEIWVVRQEYCKNPNILGLDYDPTSWHELHEILKGAYRVMASRAIDVVNQEINASLPVRVDDQPKASTPMHHVLALYGIFPNDEPKPRTVIPTELFTEEHD